MITWNDLFSYLDEKCDFHEKKKGDPESVTWICKGGTDKTFVKEFCDQHKLDFEKISKIFDMTCGFCDCEVLLNSKNQLDENLQIGDTSNCMTKFTDNGIEYLVKKE